MPEISDTRESSDVTRRRFIRDAGLTTATVAAACAIPGCRTTGDRASASDRPVRFGLITDIHYADREPAGSRHYRESPAKLNEAVNCFNAARADFVVEIGDFIDKADTAEKEIGFLTHIDRVYAKLGCERHYVLGNHCVATLSKDQFLETTSARRPPYSFDCRGLHLIVLDANFRSDGTPYPVDESDWSDANILDDQLRWLEADLQRTDGPVIVFSHQCLHDAGSVSVRNCAEVRVILERHGGVAAVFQGHAHENDHHLINGIHYCTMAAMVEGSGAQSNAYALVAMEAGGEHQGRWIPPPVRIPVAGPVIPAGYLSGA